MTKIQMDGILLVPISQLKPNSRNRNTHPPEQIDHLVKQFQYQGIRQPIIVSKRTGLIVAGHGRYLAAKKAGIDKVPVSFQDFESEEQEYAYGIADNATALWAELDLTNINDDALGLPEGFDLDLLGIKDFKLTEVTSVPGADEDEVPETPAEPKTKLGDIYQLGNHRLLCGDSTNVQHIEKLMDGEKADMVFTDPPYGINLNTDYRSLKSKRVANKFERVANKFERVANDDKDFDPSFLLEIFKDVKEIFLFGANYYAEKILNKNDGSWIVWDKRLNENLDEMYGSSFELCWSKKSRRQEIARVTWAGCFGHNKKDDGDKKVHPTMKPIKLIEWFFERATGDLVVDLFGGSGSTLIASEKTNRKCFMMELDPHYCDVIVSRWEKYTGKKAELIESKG